MHNGKAADPFSGPAVQIMWRNALVMACVLSVSVAVLVTMAMTVGVGVIAVMRFVNLVVRAAARSATQELARHPVMMSVVGNLRPAMRVFDHMHLRAAFETTQHVISRAGARTRVQRCLLRGPSRASVNRANGEGHQSKGQSAR